MELASRVHSPALARPEKMSPNFALNVKYATEATIRTLHEELGWGSIVLLAADALLKTKLASEVPQEGLLSA